MCKYLTNCTRSNANRHSIESMKMETVIRSPQDGVVKKLAHKEGVSSHQKRC